MCSERKCRDDESKYEQVNYIISATMWQDSLLQAYRNYLLIMQSIFLALAVGVFSVQTNSKGWEAYACSAMLFLIIIVGVWVLRISSTALVERSKAVDWWQKRLLAFENDISFEKHFIHFRVAKKYEFDSSTHSDFQLKQEDIDSVLRFEKPRARTLFTMFIFGAYLSWLFLFLAGLFRLKLEIVNSYFLLTSFFQTAI